MSKTVRWTEDSEIAERQHGSERDLCLARLVPETRGRWPEDARGALVRAAWESGWDSGVTAVQGEVCAALERAGWHAAASMLLAKLFGKEDA